MKLIRILSIATCATWLTGPFISSGQAAPTSGEINAQHPRPITALYPHGLRARDVMRMSVHSSSGDDVGKVKDLVVDSRSGQIVYAVVSAGGVLGLGDTARAVPMGAMRFENDRRESFVVNVTTDEFRKAPTFSAEQLGALADQNRSEYIYRSYHQNWEPLATTDNAADSASFPLRLASSLMDADLRSGDQTVGHSDDLVVNMDSRKAALLVTPNERFAGTVNPFVVPFHYVSVGSPGSDTFSARLSRDDFGHAQAFDDNAWSSSSGIYRWQVAKP